MKARDSADRVQYLTALCRTVPYHIVEAVLDDPREGSIQPTEFDGTVLFADLVGFTSMCERLAGEGPEGLSKLARILNGLFEHLLEDAIFPYQGYVVQFGGDSLTAYFTGAHHAERAAAAGLTAERLVYGEVGRLVGGKSRDLMLRVGLASGSIRLPILGDLVQRAAVCAGDAAHRALELQGEAEPNTVVVDRSTLGLLGNIAEVVERKEDRAVLRGLRRYQESQPIRVLGDRILDRVDEKITLLEPFVPGPLAGRLRTTPSDWRFQGELRTAVVGFIEIWGFEELSNRGQVAVDVSRSLLRAYRKYGGLLAKADLAPKGHRAMVLFGLHRPSENDAERALLAAIEATARIKAFTLANNLDLTVRTGLHSGRVYLGAIGSQHKHDITVVGDTVNVAARATAAAKPFEVVATDAVIGDMGEDFHLSTRDPILVKGKSVPLQLHVVHAPADGTAHYVHRRTRQRFLAGRDDELSKLDAAVDAAAEGKGTVLGICGEASTGKSALLAQVIDRWSQRGSIGIIGRCRYATRSAPLAPVIAMFNSFLGLTRRDNETQRRERIRNGLHSLELHRGAPELVALLQPVRRPDGTSEALIDLADTESREMVLDSIVEFVNKRVAQEPLLYVLEDLHLSDTLTLELAARLAHLSRDRAFLFIATYRPGAAVETFRAASHDEIRLRNLPVAAVEDLVRHELSATGVDPDLLVFIWQRSGGNPGNAAEIVRFLTDRGLLHVRAGVVGPAEPGMQMLEDVVPARLANVALARLDELGAVERRVLRTASAIGRRFDRMLVEEAADDLDSEGIDAAFGDLESRGVIVRNRQERRGYMFRDGLTRAVAYGTIPDAERRGIHTKIADSLEAASSGRERELAAILALHRERAGDLVAAATWYELAVSVALRGGLDREVRDLSQRWDSVVAGLPPEERPSAKRSARMALLRFVAASRQGSAAETLRLGRRLASQHWEALAADSRAIVDFWLGQALVMLGKPEKAIGRLERVYNGSGDSGLRCDAARTMARMLRYHHDLEGATSWLERAHEAAGDDRQRLARVTLESALLRAEHGDLPEAAALLDSVRTEAFAHHRHALLGDAAGALGRTQLQLRAFADARDTLEQALDAHRTVGRWREEAVDLVWLGQTFLWDGKPEEARPHLEKALALAQEIGDEVVTCGALVHLGAAIAWTEDPDRGAVMVEEGSRRAIRASVRPIEIEAELHLLRIAITRVDVDGIRSALRRCEVQRGHMKTPLLLTALRDLSAQAQRVLPTGPMPAL